MYYMYQVYLYTGKGPTEHSRQSVIESMTVKLSTEYLFRMPMHTPQSCCTLSPSGSE